MDAIDLKKWSKISQEIVIFKEIPFHYMKSVRFSYENGDSFQIRNTKDYVRVIMGNRDKELENIHVEFDIEKLARDVELILSDFNKKFNIKS